MPPPSQSPVLHPHRHVQRQRQRRHQHTWCVAHRLGFSIGVIATGLLLLNSGTTTTTAVAASSSPPPRAVVDDDEDSPASFTRRYHRHRHNKPRDKLSDNDDDDDDTPGTATTGGGGIVCESVIAIASTRLFHSDDDLEDNEREHNDGGSATTGSASFHGGSSESRFGIGTNRRKTKNKNKNKTETGDEEFVCELITGHTVPITATPQQVDELREALADGSLISAVSTIVVQAVTVTTPTATEGGEAAAAGGGGEEVQEVVQVAMMEEDVAQEAVQEVIASSSVDGSSGSGFIESVSLPPGSIQLQTEGTARRRRQLKQRRELASYTGTKPVLAVRVTDVNGLAPQGDANFMSDKFFGTYGDAETMVSQFASCSYDAFQIVTKQYPQLSAPGVLDVQISISLQNSSRDAIRKAVHSAVAAKLGFSATPGPFAHVLYVVEKCYVDCGWAAYAYVNSWLSVYHSKYFMYPAVALHEIGHNLNFGHSGGFDGKTYTDHSCLMGNPLFSDDIADMCYNPAKTHQLIMSNGKNGHSGNWYDASRVSTWNPGASGSTWSGTLVGVAEYGQITNGGGGDRRLVLRIVSGGSTDLYVGFNRKTGMNGDNKLGSDMVTVIQAAAGGITYSTSALKATLQQGRSFYIPNWRGDGSSLEVFADAIRTDVVPGYAIVRAAIAGGEGPANPPTNPPTRVPPTRRPTRPPTPLPTLEPSLSPVTDNPSLSPTFPPTPNPTPDPTISPTYPPSPSPNKELAAGLDTSVKRARGIMFTVAAKDHDVIITGMDIISRRNMPSDISIYTKPGTYHTESNTSSIEVNLHAEEWQEIYRGIIPSQPNKLVSLDDFNVSITIPAGQTQSFYAYVSNGLLFTAASGNSMEGGQTGDAIAAEDDGIIMYEGQVVRGLFQKVVGLGRWGGVMRYRLT